MNQLKLSNLYPNRSDNLRCIYWDAHILIGSQLMPAKFNQINSNLKPRARFKDPPIRENTRPDKNYDHLKPSYSRRRCDVNMHCCSQSGCEIFEV